MVRCARLCQYLWITHIIQLIYNEAGICIPAFSCGTLRSIRTKMVIANDDGIVTLISNNDGSHNPKLLLNFVVVVYKMAFA